MLDEVWPTEIPQFIVDDIAFVQPVGFVWFCKPRYRVKAIFRKKQEGSDGT